MSGSNSAERKRHEPLVLVETADLSEEDWLDYRRRGIGGSDVSAIFGTSPFRTARDLYYDKLNIASVEDDEGNWVAMEMGHLLEPLVAKIFERKTGYRVYQIKKMFQHPQYPWMLADVDYFVELPDGTTAILEIKTTNYNARDNWWMNGKETVPVYYESQGRHYMAVKPKPLRIAQVIQIRLSQARLSSTVRPEREKFMSSKATEAVTMAAIVEMARIWVYTSCMISLALVHTSVAA